MKLSREHPDSNEPEIVESTPTHPVTPEIVPDNESSWNNEVKTSWLHPTSLVFELFSHSRELFIPIVIAIFSAAQGSLTGLYFALLFFVPAVLFSVFRFFTLRYKIDQGELVVKQGLLFRRVRTVPISRIQNIDLVQNPLHRLFRVAEVRIETASGTEPEATLRVLSMQKIDELRRQIYDRPQAVANVGSPDLDMPAASPAIPVRETNGVTLLEIPTSWLLKAGLASNRGLLLLGIVWGAWYQFDLESKVDLERIQEMLPTPDGSLGNTLAIMGLVLLLLIVLRLFGIAWFLLRFHGYRLTLHGEDLRISCGLFTKVSATVPRKRIQFISIHRPLFMRWLGLASIRIETAGGGGMSDNASTTVSRRWFVPAISEDNISDLVGFLRPGITWNEPGLPWQPHSESMPRRLVRLALIQSLVVAGIGLAVWRPWGFAAGFAIMPLALLWARKKSRSLRYVRDEGMIVYRNGVLGRKTSMTFFDKVQTVSVFQTPFDRRWKMATLAIDTAASGPAEHRIRVRFLDEIFAQIEFATIKTDASLQQPDFG